MFWTYFALVVLVMGVFVYAAADELSYFRENLDGKID